MEQDEEYEIEGMNHDHHSDYVATLPIFFSLDSEKYEIMAVNESSNYALPIKGL